MICISDYTLSAKITADASKFQSAISKAQRALDGLQDKIDNVSGVIRGIGDTLSDLGGKLTAVETAIAAGAGVALQNAASSAIDFDTQMRKVGAIANANAAELDALSTAALELGANTSLSSSQVAQAMSEMAAKGFTSLEIIDAMPGVIAAAEASGEDLSLVADTMSNAINGFGLEADSANHVADVLAESANRTAAGVEDLQYAFKYAAPSAAALGISMEELAAATGIMVDAGLEGGQAGTTLRSMFVSMSKPTNKAQQAMEQLGLSFFDTKGNMKSISQIISELQTTMAGLTDEEKQYALSTIFGTEALSGLQAMMNAAPCSIDEMTAALQNCDGASTTVADQMKSGVGGAIENMQGALESFAITIGTSLLPTIQNAAEAVAEVLSAMTEGFNADGFSGAIEAAFGSINTLAAEGKIPSYIGNIAEKIQLLKDKLTGLKESGVPIEKIAAGLVALGPSMLVAGKATSVFGGGLESISGIFGGLSGAFGSVIGESSSFIGWFASFSDTCKNAKKPLKDLGSSIGNLAGKLKNLGNKGLGKIGDGVATLGTKFPSVTKPLIVLKTKMQEVSGNVSEKLSTAFGKVGGVFGKFQSGLSKIGAAFGGIFDAAKSFGGQFTSILMKAFGFGAIGGLILVGFGLLQENFGAEIGNFLAKVRETAPQIITDFCAGISEKIPMLISQGGALIGNLLTTLTALSPSIIDGGADIVVKLASGFAVALPGLLAKAGEFIVTIVEGITVNLPDILKAGMDVIAALVDGISSFLPDLIPAAVDMILTLAIGLIDNLPELIDSGLQLLTAVADGIVEALPKIAEKAPEIITKLATTLIDKAPELITTAGELILKLANGLIEAIPVVVQKIPEIIKAIKDKFLDTDWEQLGKDIMELVAEGLKMAVNFAIDGVNLLIDGINYIPNVDIPHIPYLAHGTDNFQGGFAVMNEGGRGELVNLPSGAQVIPHDISVKYAKEAARIDASQTIIFDYAAMGAAVAAAMEHVDVRVTSHLDGRVVADEVTPLINQNMGRQQALDRRYT